MPALQMLDCVATVAPLYMQVRPTGAIPTAGSPPPVHATARLTHAPSSHRYWVPDWQLAEPGEYDLPLNAQLWAPTGGFSVQAIANPFHCPSLQRY